MATYDLTNVNINRRLSEETLCISADLRDTATNAIVATVSNRGHGGETDMRILPESGLDWRNVERDLEAQYGEFGIDTLIERTDMIETLARKRKVMFVLPGDDDPFETGLVREVSGDRSSSLTWVRTKHPDALVFDKPSRAFVPVAQAV